MSTDRQGQTAEDSTELDADALAAIRSMIAEAPRPVRPATSASTAGAPRQVDARTRIPLRPTVQPGAAQPAWDDTSETPAENRLDARSGEVAGQTTGLIGRAKDMLTGNRLKPKWLALAAVAALSLFWPWLMVGVIFFAAFLVTAVFLVLGYDGFWRRAMALGRWYARRRPARAAAIHAKLDAFAMRWDAILDRFPEGSVDGLYLPDFGEMAVADTRHDAAMERRLNALRETGA